MVKARNKDNKKEDVYEKPKLKKVVWQGLRKDIGAAASTASCGCGCGCCGVI